MLARLLRADPELLRPIQHRSEAMQLDSMAVRVRAALVEVRIKLVRCGSQRRPPVGRDRKSRAQPAKTKRLIRNRRSRGDTASRWSASNS